MLKRKVDTSIDGVIVLSYRYDRVSVIDESVGTTYPNRRSDAIPKINRPTKACFLEEGIWCRLMNCCGSKLPMLS